MPAVSNAQLATQMETFQKAVLDSIDNFKKTSQEQNEDVVQKIGDVTQRLVTIETRIDELSDSHDNLQQRFGEHVTQTTDDVKLLIERVKKLEEKVEILEQLPKKVNDLTEQLEERTNRQLRETLVFKNVPEQEGEDSDSYLETKRLLADLISTHCDVSYDEAFDGIKRAHRETKRRNEENHYRTGKRLIFAAFHSWDLCQKITETFRTKCIREPNFQISAEQKYGPMTSRRRTMALKKRKELKDSGEISAGYINFPARLMVNTNRQVDVRGKKIYRLHTDFSKHIVE